MGKQKEARQREKLRRQRDRRQIQNKIKDSSNVHSTADVINVNSPAMGYPEALQPQLQLEAAAAFKAPLVTAGQVSPEQLHPSVSGITQEGAARRKTTETKQTGKTLYGIRRNLANRMRKNSDPSITRYQCSNFDINSVILNAPKAQPPENLNQRFEIENESQLKLLTGDIIVVTDKNGIPCIIKATGRKALPFAEEIASAMKEYAAIHGPEEDQVRHGTRATRCRNSTTAHNPTTSPSVSAGSGKEFITRVTPESEDQPSMPSRQCQNSSSTENSFRQLQHSSFKSTDSEHDVSQFVTSEMVTDINDNDELPKAKRWTSLMAKQERTSEKNMFESITLCPPTEVLPEIQLSSRQFITSAANLKTSGKTDYTQVTDDPYTDQYIEGKCFPAEASYHKQLQANYPTGKTPAQCGKLYEDSETVAITSCQSSRSKKRKREDQSVRTGGGGSINIHRAFAARYQKKTRDIEIAPGPTLSFGTKKAVQGLKTFAARIKPLTQLVETLFQTLLPSEYDIYQQAYLQTFNHEPDPVDAAFGLWTSRALVLNAVTNAHRDLLDVCRGFCALTPFGVFEGGNACFPQLGIRLECGTGSVVFIRSYPLVHYIGAYTGERLSLDYGNLIRCHSGGRSRDSIYASDYRE
ncbi:hypothetical protein HOY82DRAFT_619817 [Tuber indicum]|nr:hypothetical protein HOY82DRAFT_619817 [Tuber indicum]